jgi:hypothetical protein
MSTPPNSLKQYPFLKNSLNKKMSAEDLFDQKLTTISIDRGDMIRSADIVEEKNFELEYKAVLI